MVGPANVPGLSGILASSGPLPGQGPGQGPGLLPPPPQGVGATLAGGPGDPDMSIFDQPPPEGDIVPREGADDNTTEQRKALVSRNIENIKTAKMYWDLPFKRMVEDMQFAGGDQWGDPNVIKGDPNVNVKDQRYVANVTLRHIQQKVAALYARNPKAVAKKRKRLISKMWDGTQAQITTAMQVLRSDPGNTKAMQIVQDYNATLEYEQMMDRIAQTLELLYDYEVTESDYPFKAGMKRMVRRSVTAGVGYVKIGFQRLMKENPEVTARIADYSERLATLERLTADIADGEIEDPDAPEREQLQLLIQDLAAEPEIVAREGLLFSYPMPFAIIPDLNIIDLNGFVGCDWVAEEMLLTPQKIQEIYDVDVGKEYIAYAPTNGLQDSVEAAILSKIQGGRSSLNDYDISASNRPGAPKAMVWQQWNRTDGLVYTMCDGYADFLEEPMSPDAWTERFWPWFSLTLNDLEHPSQIFPPSDVRLIRDMQREINRSREGLREHRIANRPKTAVAAGTLDEEDIAKLENHPANAVLELNALSPGQKIEDVLQPIKMPGIDPNLYDVTPAFQDIERTVGVQEANLGGTSNSTATESSIAESSRQTQLASNTDDLNELLSALAKTGGQILLTCMSSSIVTEIVGPGAVWPELSREDIAKDIMLQVAAGSTGKPNQAQEIANAEKLVPLLLQIPGVNPEWILEQVIHRMDDSIDLTQAFSTGVPSIVWMNSQPAQGGMLGALAQLPPPANDPGAPQPGGMPGPGGAPGGMPGGMPGGGGPPPPGPPTPQGGAPQPGAGGAGPGADPAAQGPQGLFNGPAPPAAPPNDPMAPTPVRLHDYHRQGPV